MESFKGVLQVSLCLIAIVAGGASYIPAALVTPAYANGEGQADYSKWLTPADVKRVTGVKGVTQQGLNFGQQGEPLVSFVVYEGDLGRAVWQQRTRGLPQMKLRKIAGVGDEAFEEESGLARSLWARKGKYVVEMLSPSVLRGNALVPRLSSEQLQALAKIVLVNSQKPQARVPAARADEGAAEEARYAKLLTPADVEKVTGLKGVTQDGFEFLRRDGEPVVSFSLYEGEEAQSMWPGRSEPSPGVKLRKITGIGDEALEENAGAALALWVRKGRYVIKVECGSVEKGGTLVLSLSPQQVRALAKIVLARM